VLRKYLAPAASALLLIGGLALGLASGSPAVAAAIRPAHSAGLPVAARADRVAPASMTGAAPRTSIPNGTCYVWTDGTTFGTECTNVSGLSYQASGLCENGQTAAGPDVTSGWSYAYCSTYDSTLHYASVGILVNLNDASIIRDGGSLRPIVVPVHIIRKSLAVSRAEHRQQLNPVKADVASAAGEDGLCSVWTDGITFGAACSWTYGPEYFEAYAADAVCTDNYSAFGPAVYDGWSYAYCSTYDQTVEGGSIQF
jgi:hypothetical protein